MFELGAVASPIKELRSRPASAEAERCRTAHRAVGGLGTANPRPPNTRVQRTRSSPSAPHSPLTRHPLGATDGIRRAAQGERGGSPRTCDCSAHLRDAGRRSWRGGRAAVGRLLELGNSTLQESARPPAQAASAGALESNERAMQNRASRRSARSRLGRIELIVACKPNCVRAPNTRMKLQAQ